MKLNFDVTFVSLRNQLGRIRTFEEMEPRVQSKTLLECARYVSLWHKEHMECLDGVLPSTMVSRRRLIPTDGFGFTSVNPPLCYTSKPWPLWAHVVKSFVVGSRRGGTTWGKRLGCEPHWNNCSCWRRCLEEIALSCHPDGTWSSRSGLRPGLEAGSVPWESWCAFWSFLAHSLVSAAISATPICKRQ